MSSTAGIVVAVVVAIIVLGGLFLWMRARSRRLQSTFGPEYDRTVQERGRYRAESELERRKKRVAGLNIRELSPADRQRFVSDWRAVQAEFVDNPGKALTDADTLVAEVMTARGYPVQDFEQCAADLSVDHSLVVDNYRAGHGIAMRRARGEASTEEIRQAMIHYRMLLEDLLPTPHPEASSLRLAG